MGLFWILLMSIGFPLLYIFVAGLTAHIAFVRLEKSCSRPGRCLHKDGASLVGIFWPFTFPFMAGQLGGGFLTDRQPRVERREQRRKAEHARKMAEIKIRQEAHQANIKLLAEAGINAGDLALHDYVTNR